VPLVSLAVIHYLGLDNKKVKVTPKNKEDQADIEIAFYPDGDVIRGDHSAAKYIARAHTEKTNLYGKDTNAKNLSDIDQWIDLSYKISIPVINIFNFYFSINRSQIFHKSVKLV
jgi:hypothetical protein